MNKVRCEGCGSVWELKNTFKNDVYAKLVECPICVKDDKLCTV